MPESANAGRGRRLRSSLVLQLAALAAAPTLGAGALVGGLFVRQSRTALRQQILTDHLAHADLAANYIADYLKTAQQSLDACVKRMRIRDAVGRGAAATLAQPQREFLADHPIFDGVSLFDAGGTLVVTGVPDSPSLGKSFADRAWYQEVVATLRPVQGAPINSRNTGHPISPYAIPLLDERGALAGIVGFSSGRAARVSLLEAREGGLIVSHPDKTRIMGRVSGRDLGTEHAPRR